MLLIIEVALTIAAWRKGWGARALLPGFVGIAFALLLGGLMLAAGADKTSLLVVSVLTEALISVLSGSRATLRGLRWPRFSSRF